MLSTNVSITRPLRLVFITKIMWSAYIYDKPSFCKRKVENLSYQSWSDYFRTYNASGNLQTNSNLLLFRILLVSLRRQPNQLDCGEKLFWRLFGQYLGQKNCYSKKSVESHWLYYGCKGFVKIYLELLEISFYNSSFFKSSNVSINISLYFVNIFTRQ